jgi:alpha-L-rhamnosidase
MVTDLTCERRTRLLGTDEPNPRLGWRPLVQQHAYQVVVAGSGQEAAQGAGGLWDSGWVESRECFVDYAGTALPPRTRLWFSVRIRAEHGAGSEWSDPSWFEMGMLADRWDSEWLQAPFPVAGPGRIFLRVFDVVRPVQSARAYVAGLGYYELRVNARKSGDHVLDPAWTDYSRKVPYVTHDVTDLLVPGRNVVAVMVGTGRYRQPVLNLQLHMSLTDGMRSVERTDHRLWWCATASPVVEADLYNGEHFDARIRVPGWDLPLDREPGRGGGGLVRPVTAEPPGGVLRAQDVEPIRVVQDIASVSSNPVDGGAATVYDLGQNIAGWARIRLRAAAGTEIRLLYSEALRNDGQVEMRMNRGARATDAYIARGGDEEEWEPRFTYHGFRYVQTEARGPVDAFDLIARVARTDARKVGTFRCADELVNRIRAACEWTEADNLHSLPTDCPQREERMGWLNDMTVRAESALYTFDLNLLYAKWSEDVAQAQGDVTGAITDVAPFDPYHSRHYGNRPADPVSSSYLLTAWLCYLHYGDRRTLERRYPGLVRWYRYLAEQAEDGILAYSYWGDWASPAEHAVPGSVGSGAVSAITPGALVSTCYLYYDAILLSRMARVLSRDHQAAEYENDARKVAAAFNREFYDAERMCYATGSQASQAIPLALGVVPEERVAGAVAHLARDVQERGTHLTTGNLATRYVLEVLADNGLQDLAWALVTQRSYPSWGFMIDHGATTIWERWEHIRGGGMSSHNHPMYATVSGWLSKYVGGIRPSEDGPGFAQIVVRPHVPSALTWAEATLETVRGAVQVRWQQRSDGWIEYRVVIPAPSTARLELPGRRVVRQTEGLPRPVSVPGAVPRCTWTVGGGEYTIVMER